MKIELYVYPFLIPAIYEDLRTQKLWKRKQTLTLLGIKYKLLVVHSVCMLSGFPRSYEYVLIRPNTFVEKSCSWKSIRTSIHQRNTRLSNIQAFHAVLHWKIINQTYLANDPMLYDVSTFSYKKQLCINSDCSHIFRSKSATGRKFVNSLHSLYHEI
jgi:hypothetical protein